MNLQNLVDWAQFNGIDVFEGVSVPAPLNAETVKNTIMIRSGLMTPLYKEPEVFKAIVTHWFIAKQWTFEHLINIIQAEYSPIENYDRTEEHITAESGSDILAKAGGNKQTHSGTDTEAHTGTDTESHTGTDTEAHTGTDTEAHSGTDVTTNEISAENVSTYSPDSMSSVQHGESIGTTHGQTIDTTHGHSIDTEHGEQIDTTHGHIVTDEYQNRQDTTTYGKNTTINSKIHGNIGVTTNQQMIEQELELLRHFDIYGWIADKFEDENMLLIY